MSTSFVTNLLRCGFSLQSGWDWVERMLTVVPTTLIGSMDGAGAVLVRRRS
jgi:hypothetical protein